MKRNGALPMSEKSFHPLFMPEPGISSPDFKPEPIWRIFVTRLEAMGPVQALRGYLATELTGNESIYAHFGGGTYDLTARREGGSIYAKRQFTIPGDPKPMVAIPERKEQPPQALAPVQAPVQQHTDPALAMFGLIMPMMTGMMTTMGTVMAAAISGKSESSAEISRTISESMRVGAEAMAKMIPPPAPQQSPFQAGKEALEFAKLARDLGAQPKPTPPKETTSEIIGAVAGAVGQFASLALTGKGAPAIVTGPQG
jgi:hypothetical protein